MVRIFLIISWDDINKLKALCCVVCYYILLFLCSSFGYHLLESSSKDSRNLWQCYVSPLLSLLLPISNGIVQLLYGLASGGIFVSHRNDHCKRSSKDISWTSFSVCFYFSILVKLIVGLYYAVYHNLIFM